MADDQVHISEELKTFLESGLSIVVATRDGRLQPDGASGWAVSVDDSGDRLTLYLHPQAADEMLRNLERHPEIAVNFDLPTSHRACQVKGRFLAARKARKAEKPIVERQMDAFAADLVQIGVPRVMTGGWEIWPCVALEVEVTELYEQTPGPGTGGPLQ